MAFPRNEAAVTSDDASLRLDLQRIRGILLPFSLVGFTGIVLHGAATSRVVSALAGLGYSFASAVAALAFGALLGFLFGIPKMLQEGGSGPSAATSAVTTATSGGAGPATPPPDLRRGVIDNTNLEQISDWLTKLLIGATLTQLGRVRDMVGDVAIFLASNAPPGSTGSSAYFAVVVVYWSIAGFFVAYLLTRRVLPMMWHRATNFLFLQETRDAVREAFVARSQGRAPEFPDAVRQLASARMEDVPENELATWGRARALGDDFPDAVVAFEKVLARTPGDREAAEALMFASLYLPKPRGFEKVLAEGALIPDRDRSPAMHVYLAAAYGQKHQWLESVAPAAKSEMEEARRHAFEEARKALEKDPTWKGTIKGMLNSAEGDDDLSSFRDVREFQDLVT